MKRHINEFQRTWTGRVAGNGMEEDRYDDESFPDKYRHGPRKQSHYTKPMKIEAGEVVSYKLSKEEIEKRYGVTT